MCKNVVTEYLFKWPKRYWYRNLEYVPEYFYRKRFLKKHGYEKHAIWEVYSWFIETMRDVLTLYNKNRHGFHETYTHEDKPELTEDELFELNDKTWHDTVQHMIELLNKMDEQTYPVYEQDEQIFESNGNTLTVVNEIDLKCQCYEERKKILEYYAQRQKQINSAKDEFFKLFSENFFKLWD